MPTRVFLEERTTWTQPRTRPWKYSWALEKGFGRCCRLQTKPVIVLSCLEDEEMLLSHLPRLHGASPPLTSDSSEHDHGGGERGPEQVHRPAGAASSYSYRDCLCCRCGICPTYFTPSFKARGLSPRDLKSISPSSVEPSALQLGW